MLRNATRAALVTGALAASLVLDVPVGAQAQDALPTVTYKLLPAALAVEAAQAAIAACKAQGYNVTAAVADRLGMPKDAPGVSSYLLGKLPLDQCLHTCRVEGLTIIPSGPRIPNPAEQLASPHLPRATAYQ